MNQNLKPPRRMCLRETQHLKEDMMPITGFSGAPRRFYAHSTQDKDRNDWQLLDEHLTRVARLAADFAEIFNAAGLAHIAGLLHDFGKYTEEVQRRICEEGCHRMRGVVIEHRDAFEVIRQQDTPDALFFVDPPYVSSTRGSGRYRYEMDDSQHITLLTLLHSIHGRAMVSGYACTIYDDILADWQRVERPSRAHSLRDSERTEVLWISPSKG
jgi:hypothetical protein